MKNHGAILSGEPIPITIDRGKCCDCDICLDACPLTQCLGFESLEDPSLRYLCIRCGACVAVCPREAITVDGLAPALPVAPIPSGNEMLNLIKRRRSIRAFKSQPIRSEHWEKLVEAVQYSPTGHHVQHIDILIIQSPETLKKLSAIGMELFETLANRINKPIFSSFYKKMLGEHAYSVFSKAALFYDQQVELVKKGEDPVLFNAPGLILFLGPKSEFMSKTEADLAAQTVALYAPTLGLGTCYSGIVSASFSGLYPAIKKTVPVPAGYAVYNALIVGYPKHSSSTIPSRKARNVYYL